MSLFILIWKIILSVFGQTCGKICQIQRLTEMGVNEIGKGKTCGRQNSWRSISLVFSFSCSDALKQMLLKYASHNLNPVANVKHVRNNNSMRGFPKRFPQITDAAMHR